MNRTLKSLVAAGLALGLVLATAPAVSFGTGVSTLSGGGSGCCKQ